MAAGDKKEKEEGAEAEVKGGGKKKLIIIIVAVVLLIGVVATVGMIFAGGGKGEGGEHGGEAGSEESADEDGGEAGHGEDGHGASATMPLDPFIVNLQVKGSFLKTTVQLEFGTAEIPATAETDLPKIRHAIIAVLGSKSASEILTNEGKEKLRAELVDAINEQLGADDVTQVYFTEFIVQ